MGVKGDTIKIRLRLPDLTVNILSLRIFLARAQGVSAPRRRRASPTLVNIVKKPEDEVAEPLRSLLDEGAEADRVSWMALVIAAVAMAFLAWFMWDS